MQFRNVVVIASAAFGLAIAPDTARAQDERLTIHGSANIGYGRTDKLPYFGMTKDGTSDYRAIALQFGYKISDNDRVVTQLLHRKFGTSPLGAITPDIEPVWAFYEHKFNNGFSVKAGRNPLPRGIFNEIRFIGTLLPLYRVGNAVYGETLEFLDGVVVRKPFELGGGFGLDAYVFAGGYDIKAQIPSSTGTVVYKGRLENSVGTQVWLNTPIKGVRVGGFIQSYETTPRATVPEAQRPNRTTTALYSVDAAFTRAFARAELTTFKSEQPSFVDFQSYYVQGGVMPTDKITLAVEYGSGRNIVDFAPAPIADLSLPLNNDLAFGITFKQSAQVAFKVEGHAVEGYQFDAPVPSVIPPTAPPLVAKLAPKSKTYYGLVSVAFSF